MNHLEGIKQKSWATGQALGVLAALLILIVASSCNPQDSSAAQPIAPKQSTPPSADHVERLLRQFVSLNSLPKRDTASDHRMHVLMNELADVSVATPSDATEPSLASAKRLEFKDYDDQGNCTGISGAPQYTPQSQFDASKSLMSTWHGDANDFTYGTDLLRGIPASSPIRAQSILLLREWTKKQTLMQQQENKERAAAEHQENKDKGLCWTYDEQQDEMGAGTIKAAYIRSTNEVEFGAPYEGAQRAQLTLIRHPRYGREVVFQIERGQFIYGTEGGTVNVRFDEGKSQPFHAILPSDYNTTEVFLEGYTSFLSSARKAHKLSVEAVFYQEGS